jgi:hypothetical protein
MLSGGHCQGVRRLLWVDKLTHFHQLGWAYYEFYRSLRRTGLNEAEAYRQVLHRYAYTAFLAERNLFGTMGTGVYSNGDMAVNHIGFKFYLNLTEQVVVKGQARRLVAAVSSAAE